VTNNQSLRLENNFLVRTQRYYFVVSQPSKMNKKAQKGNAIIAMGNTLANNK